MTTANKWILKHISISLLFVLSHCLPVCEYFQIFIIFVQFQAVHLNNVFCSICLGCFQNLSFLSYQQCWKSADLHPFLFTDLHLITVAFSTGRTLMTSCPAKKVCTVIKSYLSPFVFLLMPTLAANVLYKILL